MNNKHGLQVSKPISLWNQPLKANFKDLFKSLSKALVAGVSLNWGDAAKSAVDGLAAIGLEKGAWTDRLVAYSSIHRPGNV